MMCIAIPVRVVDILVGDKAVVEVGGVRKEISISLVDGVGVGDYVLTHVGFAITRLDKAEAERLISYFHALALDPDNFCAHNAQEIHAS